MGLEQKWFVRNARRCAGQSAEHAFALCRFVDGADEVGDTA